MLNRATACQKLEEAAETRRPDTITKWEKTARAEKQQMAEENKWKAEKARREAEHTYAQAQDSWPLSDFYAVAARQMADANS